MISKANESSRDSNVTRTTRVILLLAAILAAAYFAFYLSANPLRKSDSDIRVWLLTKTPIGSSMASVHATLDQFGWNDPAHQQTLPSPAAKPFLGGAIGGYQGLPWHVTVRAFWEFDENDRLKNICVDRMYDSL
jgi:hypothetical protein